MTSPTAVLDLDGTLVDSVPTHVLAWKAAFRDVGVSVPSHHVQRAIGMGGDRLVTELAGEATEDALGDTVREKHAAHLDRLFGEITATEGAAELLDALRSTGHTVVLASSAERDLTERLLELVDGAATAIDHVVTGSDAETTKPAPDIVQLALDGVDVTPLRDHAVVIGDAVWDVRTAQAAGVPCVGLLTGGISDAELLDAGAVAVHDSPLALARHVRDTGGILAV